MKNKESCDKLIEDAFLKGVHRIMAECDPNNPSSWNLLEKLGFEREAHFKQNVYFGPMITINPSGKTPMFMLN